jgi:Ser/Thr protein kinase RdoA (MazF antagonist)
MEWKVNGVKAYKDLTRVGKLRRAQSVARVALNAFGFSRANLRLIVEAGNILYRVKAMDPAPIEGNLYSENSYLLRLYWPGYQSDGAIKSELEWLRSLTEAGFPVPQPLVTTEKELSVLVSVPGVPESRRCSLLRWVKGRMVTKRVQPWHMRAIGSLMARLHNHALKWKPPQGFERRHYDRNGLWGDDTGTGYTAADVLPRIPRRHFKAFRTVTTRVEQVMEDWGKRPDVYGLIHADLGTKANVLFYGGEARPIDFDDAGFGYWMYDLAIPLCDWEGENVWSTYRDALLEGYSEIRSIPKEQLDMLELFQAAYRAVEIFWGTAATMHSPNPSDWIKRRDEALRKIKRYLKRNHLH